MDRLSRPLSLDEYTLIVNEIDAFPWGSSTLKALCLAHRSFAPLCQKSLFSRVVYSSRRVDGFLDILRESPHLAGYVRRLNYYEFGDRLGFSPIPQGDAGNAAQFLDGLWNLRSFAMVDTRYDWKDMDAQFSNALLRLILSPNLRSLQLHGLRNFPVLGLLGLRGSANLKELVIGPLEVDLETLRAHFDVADSGSTAARLVNLTAGVGSAPAVRVLMGGPSSPYRNRPVLDMNGLSTISIEWGRGYHLDIGHVLIEFASCLEDLSCVLPIDSVATFHGLAASILKGPFRTLRQLRFRTRVVTENRGDPFYSGIAELRRLAGQMPSLENIDLHFQILTSDWLDAPRHLCKAIEDELCPAFDCLLGDRNAFPRLRSVSIHFMLSISHDHPIDFGIQDRFSAFSRLIKDRAFEYLDATSTIDFSFELYVQPSILDPHDV